MRLSPISLPSFLKVASERILDERRRLLQNKYQALAGLPVHASVVERNTHTQRRVCQECYQLHQAEVMVGEWWLKLSRIMGVVHETHLLGAGVPFREPHMTNPSATSKTADGDANAGGDDPPRPSTAPAQDRGRGGETLRSAALTESFKAAGGRGDGSGDLRKLRTGGTEARPRTADSRQRSVGTKRQDKGGSSGQKSSSSRAKSRPFPSDGTPARPRTAPAQSKGRKEPMALEVKPHHHQRRSSAEGDGGRDATDAPPGNDSPHPSTLSSTHPSRPHESDNKQTMRSDQELTWVSIYGPACAARLMAVMDSGLTKDGVDEVRKHAVSETPEHTKHPGPLTPAAKFAVRLLTPAYEINVCHATDTRETPRNKNVMISSAQVRKEANLFKQSLLSPDSQDNDGELSRAFDRSVEADTDPFGMSLHGGQSRNRHVNEHNHKHTHYRHSEGHGRHGE